VRSGKLALKSQGELFCRGALGKLAQRSQGEVF